MSEQAEPDLGPFGDLVGPRLRPVIVAINPSSQSAGIGYSFSSPSNPFWRLLHESGYGGRTTIVETATLERCGHIAAVLRY